MATDLPQIVECSLRGSWQGERFVNVLHFEHGGGAAILADLIALEALLAGAVGVNTSVLHYFTAMDTGAVIDTIYLKNLSNSAPIELQTTVSLAGSSGGTDMPAWIALAAKFTTILANRRGRGRIYLPGLNTGMVTAADPDHIDPTFAASVATKLNDFVAAWIANATWAFVVLSRKDRAANVATPYREVEAASVLARTSHQLRRRPLS